MPMAKRITVSQDASLSGFLEVPKSGLNVLIHFKWVTAGFTVLIIPSVKRWNRWNVPSVAAEGGADSISEIHHFWPPKAAIPSLFHHLGAEGGHSDSIVPSPPPKAAPIPSVDPSLFKTK